MAKTQQPISGTTSQRSEESKTSAATRRESQSMKRYRVRPNQTVTTGDSEGVQTTYSAGEEVELTDEQAEAMPWAVETGERRRSGQTSRLKQKIQQQQDEIKRLRAESEQRTKKGDPGREAAAESLKARGDNFIGRNEPDPDRVPPDVIDAHERGLIAAEMGEGEFGDGELESDDELAGGMKGIARATATQGRREAGGGGDLTAAGEAAKAAGSSSTSVGQASGDLKPGQSQRPGENEPR